jgi:hypothetical protein
VDPELPLSIGLQTAPWPQKFKLVSLLKYNGFGNSRQFLMRYESAVNSAGGDDVALAKSFIIAREGLVLNWYSLQLHPHGIERHQSPQTLTFFISFPDTPCKTPDFHRKI